jgi:hypothetical protein
MKEDSGSNALSEEVNIEKEANNIDNEPLDGGFRFSEMKR